MTTPVGIVGLTYNAHDLQTSDLTIFLQIVRGLAETPTVRGVDTTIPALAGRVEGNRVNDVLSIELAGWVRAAPSETTTEGARDSYQANRSLVRSIFRPSQARADLIATLEDGSQITISARPMPGILWQERVPSEFAEVSIELEGYDDWTTVGS